MGIPLYICDLHIISVGKRRIAFLFSNFVKKRQETLKKRFPSFPSSYNQLFVLFLPYKEFLEFFRFYAHI